MNNLKLIQENDFEYRIGENKTSLLEGNIIYVESNGEQNLQVAQQHIIGIRRMKEFIQGKVSYLINLNNCGKNSPEARKIWRNFSEEKDTHKVAMYGIHPVAMVIASFVTNITKKNEMRFFKTKEEALAWIKKKT